jgi:ribokinase
VTPGPLAVVGAINVDLVVSGVRLPRPGQTVVGGEFSQHHGGKGGNQAVAAARTGARVSMIGAVGDDHLGRSAVDALAAEGIDVAQVRTVEAATGTALIAVNARGENQIVVAPGANAALDEVEADLEAVAPALVLLSWEIPVPTCRAVGAWCREHGVPLVVNPAPAALRLRSLLDEATVATPNREEVLDLVAAETEPIGAARALRRRNEDLAVVITLGEDGAVVIDAEGEDYLDSPHVEAVDTTGAGDCFSGVLAAAMLAGASVREAARRAAAAAALSVTVAGAREGMPTTEAVDALLAAG